MRVADAEKVARVQLMYREVNQRIYSIGADVFRLPSDEPLSVVCECLDLSCVERIQIPGRELARARLSPEQFVVRPGHEAEAFEDVLERHAGFLIVAKDKALIERIQAADAIGNDPARRQETELK
jgi:hypothetical protein